MQNNKRYWQLGALVGVLILIGIYYIAVVTDMVKDIILLKIPLAISDLIFKQVLYCNNENMVCAAFTIFGSCIVFYAGLGGLCGLLYGKHKNRNKV